MEDVARAVASPSPKTIMIAGKECSPRPISVKELGVCERECLDAYRKSYVGGFAAVQDYFPEEERMNLLKEKAQEAAAFDLSSLPSKFAYDDKDVEVTPEFMQWLESNCAAYLPEDLPKKPKPEQVEAYKKRAAVITAILLSSGIIKESDYKTITGKDLKRTKVAYAQWWISATFEGRLSMVYQSFKHYGVTKDEVSAAVTENQGVFMEIASEIETLTAPKQGN